VLVEFSFMVEADTWVALDASFKQYVYLQGLDAIEISGLDVEQLVTDFAASGTPVCQHPIQQHLIGFICNIQGANGVEICLIPMKLLPTRALKSAPAADSV
jgi:hypothetical protein